MCSFDKKFPNSNKNVIVGHVKGIVHYARGDKERGKKKRWNQLLGWRTVIAAGVVVAGPMGAYVGGAGAAILGQAAGEKFEEMVGRTQ